MALTWNVSQIKNHAVVTTHPHRPDEWHYVTMALVEATFLTGIADITRANVDEWVRRLDLYQHNVGALLTRWTGERSEPLFITRADIEAHIGLSTNNFGQKHEKPAAWDRWFAKRLMEEAEGRVQRYYNARAVERLDAEKGIGALPPIDALK